MILARQIRITGIVQGVCFRKFVADKVKEIGGLHGLVRNEKDGSVYVEVEGERDKIKELVIACHVGNDAAEVANVNVHRTEVKGCEGFVVK